MCKVCGDEYNHDEGGLVCLQTQLAASKAEVGRLNDDVDRLNQETACCDCHIILDAKIANLTKELEDANAEIARLNPIAGDADAYRLCAEAASRDIVKAHKEIARLQLMTTKERCAEYHVQCCSWCEDFDCCDNQHPAKIKLVRAMLACRMALDYLPAKDGKRTGDPDGDAQLAVCNALKEALHGKMP